MRSLLIAFFIGSAAMAQSPDNTAAPSDTATAIPRIPGQNLAGMRVYLRAGLKTHAPGEHDYPQFLADWSKLLTERGAVVDGSLHAPRASELAETDVVVMYKGDAGYMTDGERADLRAYIKRGGGLVILHDPLCGPDPAEFASYVGGAKKHGEVNYTLGADIPLTITDRASPIMKGMTDITLYDEAFYNMTWAPSPAIQVLATTRIPDTEAARRGGGVGQVVPQIWTYEHRLDGGEPARAFVWMQGHTYANFARPQVRDMLLRGIAWAGNKPVDSLVDYVPPARRQATDYVTVRNEVVVEANADKVWARIGDYCAISEWLPTTCTLQGSGEPGVTRILANGTVVEPMVARTARSYTYWQTVGNLAAAGMHGTLAAEPDGERRTKLSYTIAYDQAALASDALRASERARLQKRFAEALHTMKRLSEAR